MVQPGNRQSPAHALDSEGAAALASNVREIRRRGSRPASVQIRQLVVRLFGEFIAPRPLLAATVDDVEAWIDDQIERELSIQSRATYLVQLRGFFSWAARRGLATDPTVDQRSPKVHAGQPRPIPEADLQRAIQEAVQPVRAWLVLGAYCGLRAGEIARLRRAHVLDLDHPPRLVVANGKGGRSRILPLAAGVLVELRPHLAVQRDRLWLDDVERPEVRVSRSVAAHLRGLGLPYSCHSLRHRFGSQIYQRSRDLRMTQDMMGHSSPATTQIYAAWDTGRGVDVVAELGDVLVAGRPEDEMDHDVTLSAADVERLRDYMRRADELLADDTVDVSIAPGLLWQLSGALAALLDGSLAMAPADVSRVRQALAEAQAVALIERDHW